MKRIVTDPVYLKAHKVVNSIEHPEQYVPALNYIGLTRKYLNRKLGADKHSINALYSSVDINRYVSALEKDLVKKRTEVLRDAR